MSISALHFEVDKVRLCSLLLTSRLSIFHKNANLAFILTNLEFRMPNLNFEMTKSGV